MDGGIKLAVFDLDGTLVNSIADLAAATEYVLMNNGYPPNDPDDYRFFVGNGTLKLIERALPQGVDSEEIDRIHSLFSERYSEHCLDFTRPYDGIPDTLKLLKERGYKLAVASNKPDTFSKRIVETLFGKDCFDSVHGKRDNVLKKPAADILLSIMGELGETAQSTIMIGDSDVDVKTAHNAEIECIGCEWGFRGKDELLRAGAEYTVQTPLEIADILSACGSI